MTVKECYSQMNGDYNNVLSRFYDEAMIKRLLGRFIDDTSFRALEQAMAEGDVQAAFNAAHTLRGVCQSLSFTQLCGTLDPITEALRGGNIAAAAADMGHLSRVNAQKSKNNFQEARMRAISSRKSCSEHR